MELIMGCLLVICFGILSRQAAEVSKAFSENSEERVIVVDPGHGGADPGMIGIGGLEEKGINLAVSWKLKECLEEEGFTVVLTRETDAGLYEEDAVNKKAQDMSRRIELIEKTDPLLTVSIHQNSYSDSSVKGPQVFYYKGSTEGERLAGILQENLNTALSIARPRIQKGDSSYYLLKKSSGVLVIAECGFLTNPDEAALLQNEAYQKKLAEAITAGILQYLGVKGKNL